MCHGVGVDTNDVLQMIREVAAEVITPRFRSLHDGDVSEKRPGDLVTVADREAEDAITSRLRAAYPDAVILGEEAYAGDRSLIAAFRAADHGFTIDPIDGTKNFVNGSVDHAVMVAETRGANVVRSWIWQPAHEVAWVAERGAGVFRDGVRMHRAPVGDGERPQGVTSIWALRGHTLGELPPMDLSWVCCGVDYPRLIEGATDYILYGSTNPWDHAPGTLMVAEAGGLSGHPDGTVYGPRNDLAGLIIAVSPATFASVRQRAAEVWPQDKAS